MKIPLIKQIPLRLSIEYGYSRFVDTDPDTLPQFFKDLNAGLRSANNFLLSISAYLNGHLGLGLFYSRYLSQVSLNAYALSIGQKTFSGPYRETISVNYFGPVLGLKSNALRKRFVFIADLRPGLVLHFDKIRLADVIYQLSSPVPGLGGSVGVDYLLKNSISLGLSVNGMYATVPKHRDSSGNLIKDASNISRIDLNLGITFNVIPNEQESRSLGIYRGIR